MNAPAAPAERRRGDRRGPGRRSEPPEESWFGALGLSTASPANEGWADADEAAMAGGLHSVDGSGADAHFLSREARRIVNSGVTAFQRIYAAFVAARAALGIALLSTQLVSELLGVRPPLAVTLICLAYAAQTLILWLLPRFKAAAGAGQGGGSKLSGAQWFSTIGFDVLCFAALHLAAPASGLNYVALFVLPVLTAGVLTSRLAALACAAGVALILLVAAWLGAGADAALGITQAGLAGSGFFVITLLAGELASRLAREELTARGSLEFARQQAQLNRLVLQEMGDGVLVVDRKGKVRTANPAARSLLAPSGMAPPAPFQLRGVEAWGPLVRSVERAFAEGVWPEAGRDVLLAFAPEQARTLRLRVRFTRKREGAGADEASEDYCVLFVEDMRAVQARTRQERLAAMGRVSAGIAHEIRNPLAAIAQANALMAEDAIDPAQRRLTQMVSDNVERLKRIVDDVMELAPGDPHAGTVIDAAAAVLAICGDWALTAKLPPGDGAPLVMDVAAEPLGALFDTEHLRRVLVNLLDNARRHGREQPGSIVLRLSARGEGLVVLSVASGGPPIAPDVERYLFEPFFSSRSRGTGLGLYICRELCERYGASIEYRQRGEPEVNRNEFVVMMRRENLQSPYGSSLRSLSAS